MESTNFLYWQKFKKARSFFNDFSVTAVKNGHALLVRETPTFAIFSEC